MTRWIVIQPAIAAIRSSRGTLPSGGAFANASTPSPIPDGAFMPSSSASTLKGPRRLVRQAARRIASPRWQFLRGFLKHPVMVGSIIPSSRILIDRMLGPVDWGKTKLFVEYGPGVGTFTRPILDRLGPEARLVTIDTNPDFTAYLRQAIDDPRLIAVTGSAAEVEKILAGRDLGQADYVLSGLPFSTLPSGAGEAIAEATARVIRPGGAFLVYQFSPKVLDFIKPWFEKIDRGFEWLNVPPATLFWAWREPNPPSR
jgi:phospholipid N-methyltransferase